jgi:hypothetical protein
MRSFLSLAIPFAGILSLSACATGHSFNRGELREELSGGKPEVDDASIAAALARKAQLPKPFKVGIYFKAPGSPKYISAKWRWTDDDKEKLLALGEKLKATGEISDVFIVDDSVVSGSDLKSLRLAAAEHGADALLIVNGVSEVDSHANGWAWTYIALVPALFVPGTESDSIFMASASMWDVRNEFLYMTAEAESEKSKNRPAAFTDEHKVTDEAKLEAYDKLRDQISKMITSLAKQSQQAG